MDFVNNKNCLMVDEKSPKEIAKFILKLKNGAHPFELEENRKKIISEYNKEAFFDRFLTQLNSI